MRAIQMQEFGGPEVLKLVELPVPSWAQLANASSLVLDRGCEWGWAPERV